MKLPSFKKMILLIILSGIICLFSAGCGEKTSQSEEDLGQTITADVQIVYDGKLDDEQLPDDTSPYYDYPVLAARSLRLVVSEACHVEEERILLQRDNAAVEGSEIAVGLTNRPITAELLALFDNINCYGFLVKNGHIAVAGYNDVTLTLALNSFITYFNDLTKQDNDDGICSILLPDYDVVIEVYTDENSGWVTNCPLPDYANLTLTGSVDVGSGAVEYYFTGAGATAANFMAYCATLAADGYTLYTSNEIEGSLYRTYKNSNTMIYVAYAAFSHAVEQNVTRWESCIRIITAPLGESLLSNVRLIEADAFSRDLTLSSYTKITDTKITTMQLNHELSGMNGSAFIITLEDGSFVVIDGGIDPAHTKAYNEETGEYDKPVTSTGDEDRLYTILCDLYYMTHGAAADDDENRIRLAAWYVTHFHEDHTGNFMKFADKYGNKIDVERVIANTPSESECVNSYDPTPYYIEQLPGTCNRFLTPAPYYKIHTGWKFYIRNVEFEVLFTHEDLYPERIDFFNNTSTIVRMTIYNTDGDGNIRSAPISVLWLGDLQTKGSQFLRASYGSYLRSDMCQVSHHGGNGCECALYQLAAPRCLLWPSSYSFVRQYFRDNTYSSGYSVIDRHLIHDLPTLEYVTVCDKQSATITVTREGPQFSLEDLYNASDNDENPIIQYATLDIAGGIFHVTH